MYHFNIYTDSYAGNFEREMCAYITGQIGECGVGSIELAEEELTPEEFKYFEDNIAQVPDDHGCFRPVAFASDDINGLCIFFNSRPKLEIIALMKSRAVAYGEDHDIKIKRVTLTESKTVTELHWQFDLEK